MEFIFLPTRLERYEDFKNRGIKVEFIKIDKNENN